MEGLPKNVEGLQKNMEGLQKKGSTEKDTYEVLHSCLYSVLKITQLDFLKKYKTESKYKNKNKTQNLWTDKNSLVGVLTFSFILGLAFWSQRY